MLPPDIEMEGVQHVPEAIHGGPLPLTTGSEPSAPWEAVADEVLAAIVAKIEPRLRDASESIYADLLYTAQDYLADNAKFNIASRIEAADRQSLIDRQRVKYLRDLISRLTGSLHDYVHAAGPADEKDAALLREGGSVSAWGEPGPGFGGQQP